MIVPDGVSRVYSEQPFIAEYRKFLGQKECQAIIDLVPNLTFTQGRVRIDGKHQINVAQRNALTHIIRAQDPVILTSLLTKMAGWLQLPNVEWIESGLLVHYPLGGEFKQHTDMVVTKDNQGKVTNRVATVIVYLNNDYEGGNTVFPYKDITVKPAVGKALLFQYNYQNQAMNSMTVHVGNKVHHGNKFVLIFFIRDGEYSQELRDISVY